MAQLDKDFRPDYFYLSSQDQFNYEPKGLEGNLGSLIDVEYAIM